MSDDFKMTRIPELMTDTGIHRLSELEGRTTNAEIVLGNKPLTTDEEEAMIERGLLGRVLRVGDEVAWRHGWGVDAPRSARILRIELDCNAAAENGECVESCSWLDAHKITTVVDLDNGHWAYGDQIYPDMASAHARKLP